MSDRPEDVPPPPDGYDPRYNPVAFYIQLLAAHDQGVMTGRPLLTEAGVKEVQYFLDLERAGRSEGPGPAAGPAGVGERPRWDGRQLLLGEVVLKTFKQPAPHQTAVLAALEDLGWPAGPVPDPIPAEPGDDADVAGHRLHETVNNLNRGLPAGTVRFHVYGTCVWWERLPPSGEGDAG